MAKYSPLLAPFDKAASLLSSNTYDLVPFARGSIASQIASKSRPSFNLDLPGLPGILSEIPGAGGFLSDLSGIVKDLSILNFPGLLSDLVRVIPDLANFVGQQLSLGLSVLAIMQNVAEGKTDVMKAVSSAYGDYFFGDKGYTTLEGGSISAPEFDDTSVANLDQLRSQLRTYASLKTAEQYVRDLIRITVEATGNALFKLDGPLGRYKKLQAAADADAKTRQTWFKGFSSMAESTVTSAVEEAAQGVSSFSSSPLIAASLGTFAGTAARKATQNAFLLEVDIAI